MMCGQKDKTDEWWRWPRGGTKIAALLSKNVCFFLKILVPKNCKNQRFLLFKKILKFKKIYSIFSPSKSQSASPTCLAKKKFTQANIERWLLPHKLKATERRSKKKLQNSRNWKCVTIESTKIFSSLNVCLCLREWEREAMRKQQQKEYFLSINKRKG